MSPPRQFLDLRAERASGRSRPLATAALAWLVCAGCSEPQFDKPDAPDASPSGLTGAKDDAAVASNGSTPRSDASSSALDASGSSDPKQEAGASPPIAQEAGATTPTAAEGDAGVVTTQADAGPAVDRPVWAPQLIGQFALESYAFDGSDVLNGIAIAREVIWAKVSEDYQLTTTQCLSTWTNDRMTATVAFSEKLPPRRHRILFRGDSFLTEPIDIALGYSTDPISECATKPGETITAPMPRAWTSATTCRCPGPLLPPEDDCRVTDADQDGVAGYTVIGQIAGFGRSEVYGVTEVRSQYLNGMPRPNGDGFVAQLEIRDSSLQHSCKPTCVSLSGSSASCDPATSRVTLIPLSKFETPAGGWSCSAVLARAGELFAAPPVKPRSCR